MGAVRVRVADVEVSFDAVAVVPVVSPDEETAEQRAERARREYEATLFHSTSD